MASASKVYKVRKRLKARKAGRKRKNRIEREGSTPKWDDLFDGPAEKKDAE